MRESTVVHGRVELTRISALPVVPERDTTGPTRFGTGSSSSALRMRRKPSLYEAVRNVLGPLDPLGRRGDARSRATRPCREHTGPCQSSWAALDVGPGLLGAAGPAGRAGTQRYQARTP